MRAICSYTHGRALPHFRIFEDVRKLRADGIKQLSDPIEKANGHGQTDGKERSGEGIHVFFPNSCAAAITSTATHCAAIPVLPMRHDPDVGISSPGLFLEAVWRC